MTPVQGEQIIELLRAHDGHRLTVVLADGQELAVTNIAWARDLGADYDHVTTNVSPDVQDAAIDFFLTCDVRSIHDPATNAALFTAT
ncbi:MAG: hypothetical protein U1E50_11440 [Caulobacteraceae bacterium]